MSGISNKFEEKYYGFLFHYYRGEVYRETSWRNRLDTTTNWSIVVTAAMLSFEFGTPGISHAVIIINYLIVWFFLYIEARRFRYYSVVRERVKLFEKHILGPVFNFDESETEAEEWINELGEKLVRPRVRMSRIESLSWRLRRNYIFIFSIIFIVWIYKVSVEPHRANNIFEFIDNANVGFVHGSIVIASMLLSLCGAWVVAFYVSRRHKGSDLP